MGACFSGPQSQDKPQNSASIRVDTDKPSPVGQAPSEGNLKSYPLEALRRATSGFSADALLGRGGFGNVYKGVILEHVAAGGAVTCAVKRLNPGSKQGLKECMKEMEILSTTQHPNLVRLYGSCLDGEEAILVYEYLPLGSVDYHLYGVRDGQSPLPFEHRVQIALQSASALAFLHEKNIIHRDFKAANVLLDAKYNAKLTDFGFAKIAEADRTHMSTDIMGSEGYLDPSYMETAQLRKDSDVFSFGVFLLVLLSGRSAAGTGSAPPLSTWFCDQCPADISARPIGPDLFVDPKILPSMGKLEKKLAVKLAYVARRCLGEPASRPEMSDISTTILSVVEGYNSSLAKASAF